MGHQKQSSQNKRYNMRKIDNDLAIVDMSGPIQSIKSLISANSHLAQTSENHFSIFLSFEREKMEVVSVIERKRNFFFHSIVEVRFQTKYVCKMLLFNQILLKVILDLVKRKFNFVLTIQKVCFLFWKTILYKKLHKLTILEEDAKCKCTGILIKYKHVLPKKYNNCKAFIGLTRTMFRSVLRQKTQFLDVLKHTKRQNILTKIWFWPLLTLTIGQQNDSEQFKAYYTSLSARSDPAQVGKQ